MNSESAGHREQPDVPGAPNAPSTRPRAFHRRRRTDGPAFTRPDQYLGQSLYPLRAAFADPAEATAPPTTAADTPFERLSSIEGLAGAWQMVLVRDARDGLLQRQTRLIAGDLDRFLAELSASLREGTYLPAPLLRTDVEDYFPNLDVEDALTVLAPVVGCPRTIDLIRLIARPHSVLDRKSVV